MIKGNKEILHILLFIEKYLECNTEKDYIIVKKDGKIY